MTAITIGAQSTHSPRSQRNRLMALLSTNPYKPEDDRKIYGFGIGGPILKDRLFFFFAFDRYDKNYPGTAKASNPTAFFASPVADLTAFGGSCATLNAPAITNPNQRAATQGACTLFNNLSLPDYATAVADYNSGLKGLLSETGAVPRKGQATIFFPKIDWTINSRNHATFEVNRMRWASPCRHSDPGQQHVRHRQLRQ